jgi:type IV pilus assembly protein PilF
MQKLSYSNRQYLSARGFLERYLAVAKHTPETLSTAFQTERALGNSKGADGFADELLTQFPLSKEAQLIKTATGR